MPPTKQDIQQLDGTNRTIIVTGEGVNVYAMLVQKHALKMEILGMRRRGKSVYSVIKAKYGLTGNRKNVLAQFERLIEQKVEADRVGIN